jgi:hypothetical protein
MGELIHILIFVLPSNGHYYTGSMNRPMGYIFFGTNGFALVQWTIYHQCQWFSIWSDGLYIIRINDSSMSNGLTILPDCECTSWHPSLYYGYQEISLHCFTPPIAQAVSHFPGS